jgi:ABC-type nitrate/sulfonate/bicarbonate transport system ATPase subunit
VFSGRPGKIKSEIRVDLPRPREFTDPKLAEFSTRVMAELEEASKK